MDKNPHTIRAPPAAAPVRSAPLSAVSPPLTFPTPSPPRPSPPPAPSAPFRRLALSLYSPLPSPSFRKLTNLYDKNQEMIRILDHRFIFD